MATTPSTLTTLQLNRATLARQMLLSREPMATTAAVERLAGMQSQLARPPFVGLWTRIEGFQRKNLIDPLLRREIIRATAMRGTLHLMSAADYVALRGALQSMLTKGMQAILRERAQDLGMDALQTEARAFFGGKPATFDALRNHLKAKNPAADERAMAYAIRMHLPLVQVPTDDAWGFPAASDFALADDWLGKKVPTDEAPAHTLVRRYLAAFGPATPRDAQVWSGLQSLRTVFEELRPELVTFRDERKRELFDLPDAPRPGEDTPAPVRFLPEFDNLVLAHDDRTRVIADEHRPKVTLKNLQVRATFLVDGFVAGTWKVERKKKTATLVLEPFGKLIKKTLAELEQEGDALLRFVEEDALETDVRVAA
ncbi:MAG TPA: winged helix DNA-binding domain-containing protein [Thermoanaerobaculia bacterium]|nr:winged helix DNA-binding domain-containing protein [Thermoanaerobaculia bacterium]